MKESVLDTLINRRLIYKEENKEVGPYITALCKFISAA